MTIKELKNALDQIVSMGVENENDQVRVFHCDNTEYFVDHLDFNNEGHHEIVIDDGAFPVEPVVWKKVTKKGLNHV